MKCIVYDNCSTVKTECDFCEDYGGYKPRDKKILSPRQERTRLERKARAKDKKRSPASMRGRNSRIKGRKGERDLKKLFDQETLPISEVPRSGALKASGGKLIGGEDNYAGDMILEANNKKYRIEVKVGRQVPKYIGENQADGIEGFCRLFTFPQFIDFLRSGLHDILPLVLLPDEKKKKLHDFFDQDDCSVVAMSPHGTTKWYFAVRNQYINELGGCCK